MACNASIYVVLCLSARSTYERLHGQEDVIARRILFSQMITYLPTSLPIGTIFFSLLFSAHYIEGLHVFSLPFLCVSHIIPSTRTGPDRTRSLPYFGREFYLGSVGVYLMWGKGPVVFPNGTMGIHVIVGCPSHYMQI